MGAEVGCVAKGKWRWRGREVLGRGSQVSQRESNHHSACLWELGLFSLLSLSEDICCYCSFTVWRHTVFSSVLPVAQLHVSPSV